MSRSFVAAIFVLSIVANGELAPKRKAQSVYVEVFYETLCKDSINFIKEQLWPTYNALNGTGIVRFNLYPYGKATQKKVGDKWVFKCQHHEKECQLNLVETCVKAVYWSNKPKFMKFVHCLAVTPTMEATKRCAAESGVYWNVIKICLDTPWGNQMQHYYGTITEKLKPKLTSVPWVVVNNKFSIRNQILAQKDLKKLVCDAYKGDKPKQCN